jgi:protein-disulfide isomerase
MSKQFWGVIIVVILIFVGIFALSGNKSNNSSGKSGGTPTNHVEGNGKAGITLVEYGDYQCPFCGQYYPIVKQVQQEFNDQMTFQFRNYPLTSLHPNAYAAARAAEAAGLQGKFWQMHDLLYEENDANQQDPSSPSWITASDPTTFFNQFAQQLGLNVTQFKSDYASGKVNDLISADMAAGNKLKITATPTFILDGKQISVGESASAFESLIKAEIAKKSGQSSSSAPANSGTTQQTQSNQPQSSSGQ